MKTNKMKEKEEVKNITNFMYQYDKTRPHFQGEGFYKNHTFIYDNGDFYIIFNNDTTTSVATYGEVIYKAGSRMKIQSDTPPYKQILKMLIDNLK